FCIWSLIFRFILSTSHRSLTAVVHNVARTPLNRRKGINPVQNGVWNCRAVIKQCRLRDWKFKFARRSTETHKVCTGHKNDLFKVVRVSTNQFGFVQELGREIERTLCLLFNWFEIRLHAAAASSGVPNIENQPILIE